MIESRRPAQRGPRETAALAALLAATFALRTLCADQPIVENYVGRQIPTAMVARNLERGSGFLHPQLHTAPFPNLFLVEPPLYAEFVVGLRRLANVPLDPAGRLVSALGLTLGAWGLYGLIRRREGTRTALLALLAFAVFPITIRYGRAFQPDALMLGCLVAGLRCWDEHAAGGNLTWLFAGWLLLATGLALKIVSAYLLLPLVLVIVGRTRPRMCALALSTLLPAFAWYVYVAFALGEGTGSKASADNSMIWLHALFPSALFRTTTLVHIGRFLVIRAFTPLGFALGLWGLVQPRSTDRLWGVWGLSATVALAVLAAKLHHEYYWLSLAPLAAVGVGRALNPLKPNMQALFVCGLLALAIVQSASTWRTPAEWSHIREAAQIVHESVPADAWVVAPEALLYAADRRGCRLEFSRASVQRAAGEWGTGESATDAAELVEFYKNHGARFFADLGDAAAAGDSARLALHKAIRSRYKILVDLPGVVLLAVLNDPEP